MATPIHQEVTLPASPARIYAAYMDSAEHAAFTEGGPAEISPEAGGAFSCHGGGIQGRTIQLEPDRLIVQAWRVANWPEGVYSIVRIALEPDGAGTKLTLDHDAFPAEAGEHLAGGWHARYWEPLAKYLAS
jgi:uncharacterized protein YndB with AHSA1/START domain